VEDGTWGSLPPAGTLGRTKSRLQLEDDLRAWRDWIPKMWTLPLAMACDSFCLATFAPGVLLFIYDEPRVTLLSAPLVRSDITVSKDVFFILYNLSTAIGGFIGRYSAYHLRCVVHPMWYTALSAVGVMIVVLGTPGRLLAAMGPMLAPFAGMLIFLGDGFIYNTIGRSIDMQVPKDRNLAAISCWFFIGDFGSVAGSNLIPYIRNWVA